MNATISRFGALLVIPAAALVGSHADALDVVEADNMVLTNTAAAPSTPAIRHTIRRQNGTWQAFANPGNPAGTTNSTYYASIDAQSVDGNGARFILSQTAGLYHTIRLADGSWQPSGWQKVATPAGVFFGDVGMAAVASGPGQWELHICAAGEVGPQGSQKRELYHGIRHIDGTWSSFNLFNLFTSHDVRTTDCAAQGDSLHVVAVDGGIISHTIRFGNGQWQQPAVRGNPESTGVVTSLAAANSAGNIHVLAVQNGKLFHTIRWTSTGVWDPWNRVYNVSDVEKVAAGVVASDLHVAVATTGGSELHTIRFSGSGLWSALSSVEAQAGEVGRVYDVALTGANHQY
jgi:hypothetical protein